MQRLREQGVAWDEVFSGDLEIARKKSLSEIEETKILNSLRYYFDAKNLEKDNIQLHIFCDAKSNVYGSVAYLR